MQTDLAVQAGFDGSNLCVHPLLLNVGFSPVIGPQASYGSVEPQAGIGCVFAIQNGIDDGTTQNRRQSL